MNGHNSEAWDYRTRISPLCNPGTTNVCSPACAFHVTGFWDACQELWRELTGGNPANTPIFMPPQHQTPQLRAECRKHTSPAPELLSPTEVLTHRVQHGSWRLVSARRCLGKVVPSYLLHAFAVQVLCSCHSSKIVRLSCCLENTEHPLSSQHFQVTHSITLPTYPQNLQSFWWPGKGHTKISEV